MSKRINLQFKFTIQVKTTSLAGGLHCPYKGLLPLAPGRRLMDLPTALLPQASPKGPFLLPSYSGQPLGFLLLLWIPASPEGASLIAPFYRLTRERVYILIQCHNIISELLPFRYPIISDTLYFGGILTNICT